MATQLALTVHVRLLKQEKKITCARLLATYTVIKTKAKNVMCTLIEAVHGY